MLTLIYGFAAWLAETTLIGWVLKNLKMLAIVAGVTLAASAVSGIVGYFKGYDAAEAGCQAATKQREIDELKRDKAVQQTTSIQLTEALIRQKTRTAELEQRIAQHAAKVKPIKGCVVFRNPPAGLRAPRH